MKIQIGLTTYEDSDISFDPEKGYVMLQLTTDDSISEIAGVLDSDQTLIVLDDNDVETGRWYVHTVMGIYENYESAPEGTPRVVVVSVRATTLNAEAEAALTGSIGENTDAILELAELIADMDEANTRITRIEGILEGIPQDLIMRFDAINNAYNALTDRVAALENRIEEGN